MPKTKFQDYAYCPECPRQARCWIVWDLFEEPICQLPFASVEIPRYKKEEQKQERKGEQQNG